MKKAIALILFVAAIANTYAQEPRIKQLERDLKEHIQLDTLRVNRINELLSLITVSTDSLDAMTSEALFISQKLHYGAGKAEAMIYRGKLIYRKNNIPQAHQLMQQAIAIAETLPDKTHLSNAYNGLSSLYSLTGESKQAIVYALKAEAVAQITQDKKLMATRQVSVATLYSIAGDFTRAMEWGLKAEKNAEEANDLFELAQTWGAMAAIYTSTGDQANSLLYYKKALDANKKLGNRLLQFSLFNRIGELYRLTGKYNEAIKAYQDGLMSTQIPYNTELTQSNMADVYVRLGNFPLAFKYAFISLASAQKINDTEGEEWIDGILARAYLKLGKPDSALYYARIGYGKAQKTSTIEFQRDNSEALTNAYALEKDYANAYKYHVLFIGYRDRMLNAQVTNQTSLLQYNYALAKKQAQITTLNQEKKQQYFFLAGTLGVAGIIGIMLIILVRNNRQKQKANTLLNEQKKIIEDQRDETNKALAELQVTQTQLVQREKMASLGEMTAGIAHEIQNPLNFVNNFSEVSMELMEELKEGLDKGDTAEAKAITGDIIENLGKIRHHGKRADFIVKGMLEHSRTSTGERQETNINVLADEFLKLSYHGVRAKDKDFNTAMTTNFDKTLPRLNIVQQDIGRVLINLFSNAFYAVNQKAKTAGPDYKPAVEVSTVAENGSVLVKVKDNGNGIPDAIRDKIMQPFFTTKPTGEGTGLGLSLSYDIVVKGHGGRIVVDTQQGEFTEFTVRLPL